MVDICLQISFKEIQFLICVLKHDIYHVFQKAASSPSVKKTTNNELLCSRLKKKKRDRFHLLSL